MCHPPNHAICLAYGLHGSPYAKQMAAMGPAQQAAEELRLAMHMLVDTHGDTQDLLLVHVKQPSTMHLRFSLSVDTWQLFGCI